MPGDGRTTGRDNGSGAPLPRAALPSGLFETAST